VTNTERTEERTRSRRSKLILLAAIVVLSGLALAGWTQTWFSVVIAGEAGEHATAVDGQTAAPATMALALSSLALAAALAIAGPVFRVVLGILSAVIGGCIALSAGLALGDPVSASRAAVTAVTGIAGDESIAGIVERADASAWPVVTLITGIAIIAAGVAVCFTASRWPVASRRYRATRFAPAGEQDDRDAVDTWDDLSHGDDPTR